MDTRLLAGVLGALVGLGYATVGRLVARKARGRPIVAGFAAFWLGGARGRAARARVEGRGPAAPHRGDVREPRPLLRAQLPRVAHGLVAVVGARGEAAGPRRGARDARDRVGRVAAAPRGGRPPRG